jgi:flagellar biosynthesis protein
MNKKNKSLGNIVDLIEAVALKYSPLRDTAPKITAKGRGIIAEKIIDLAKKHNIPIQKDPDLVHILSQLNLEDEIPESVYQVVAEILAFVYSLNAQMVSKDY